MRPNNKIIWDAVDASVTQTSSAFQLNQVYGWSAQFVFTGSPVGSFKAQVSDDPGSLAPYDNPGSSVTHWSDLQDSTIAVSGSGTPGINYNGTFYNWIRFVYTASSGTGTLSARLNSKGV